MHLSSADYKLLARVRNERNNLHHAKERQTYLDEGCFRELVNIVGRFDWFIADKLRGERDDRM